MAIAPAPRLYGLDAISAAALRAGGEQGATFARRVFERLADKDLAAAPAEQRAAIALALLAFARRRLPGIAKVRMFNPTEEAHGFESRHSIVHIVNDDMPFLVDSITNELTRREINVHLLAHPVLAVRRDLDGDLLDFGPEANAVSGAGAVSGERGGRPESMMHIEIDRQAEPGQLDEITAALTRVLAEVRLAVDDWRPMRQACLDAIADLAPRRAALQDEYEDFLQWLEAGNFTFLGHRRYRYVDDPAQAGGLRYDIMPGSALGILRRDEARLFDAGLGGGEAMARFARGADNILIVKADRASLVHRSGPLDCVIVKTCDTDGRVTGERRFAGLFTSAAYHAMASDVPL
ncbi:MAG: NAD-glutamate dehydrogenase, partial [Reyranella sp.]|nr:NAD-glutamate dehydrogenase [Reyranella sp.]